MKYILTSCTLFVSAFSFSQTFGWVKTAGAAQADWATGVATDNAGHVFTTGGFNGTVDFDPGAGVFNLTAAGYEVFISKFDTAGNFLWAGNIGGASNDQSYAMCVDASNNVIVAGYFQSTADFDPGAGTFNMTALSSDIFICKLNNNGGLVWAKQIGGNLNDEAHAITSDALGNIYVSGYFRSTADFDPGTGTYNLTATGTSAPFVVKLDPSGNLVWAAHFDAGYGQGNGIAVDNNYNVYASGYFGTACDFDPGPGTYNLTSGGMSDGYLAHLSADGSFGWAIQINGADMSSVNSVVKYDDDVFVTGEFVAQNDFDGGAGTNNVTSAGSYDGFVGKYAAADGSFQWVKTWGSLGAEYSVYLINDANNNLFACGSFGGTVDFDPGAGVSNMTAGGTGDSNILLLDSTGTFMWAKQMGSSTMDYATALSLRDGALYSSGSFNTGCDFDPDVPVFTVNTNGNTDAYTHKLAGVTTGIIEIEEQNILVYPNPASQSVTIYLHRFNVGQVTIELLDITGKLVYSEAANTANAKIINLTAFKPGMYVVRVSNNEFSYCKKVVKE